MKIADPPEKELEIPEILPVIPIRDVTIFPFIIQPLAVGRKKSVRAVEAALGGSRLVALVAQKEESLEDPGQQDLNSVGTVAMIMRMLKLPDDRIRVLVQGIHRCEVEYFTMDEPMFEAKVGLLNDVKNSAENLEEQALIRNVKSLLERSASLGKSLSSEVLIIANSMDEPGRLADLVASNIELKMNDRQTVLQELDVGVRLKLVNDFLSKEVALLEMQQQISSQARGQLDRTQRDFYLRQQLKVIQAELGEGNELQEEIDAYRAKLKDLVMTEEAQKEAEKQIGRLEHMHPDAAETGIIRSYLDLLTELPWGKFSQDDLNLSRAAKVLDADHYGLDEVKERIIEFLSVRKLNPQMKNPILCFVGPPGVGKTSLGKSIATALGRQYIRISLGGLRDEAEIRGHRKTYVGALPGRIIQGINQAGTMNPVFVMDEVDKVGQDFRGDPSAALLEALDPEQNDHFRDHYLSVPFDLSKIMFVLTANTLDPILPAFRDRMEIIELGSYTPLEKLQIARRHLVPKQIREHGLNKSWISFSSGALDLLISKYTREAGLRNMERLIAKVCRKIARRIAENGPDKYKVLVGNLHEYLGPSRIYPDQRLRRNQVGIVAGLAWTPQGGEILFVEASLMEGKGRLVLTGHLGEVMKESAQIALSLIHTRADQYGISEKLFTSKDVHVHFPEGAIPKDGPSAGITVATALLSCYTGRPVRCDVSMTGELTLRGEILPIGGLKEKALAAARAGIRIVLFPKPNNRELLEIPNEVRKQCEFRPVTDISEVFSQAVQL